ncbi:glucose-1-phosphate cytidylyltransferase [Metabacillus fastidiosus]|uniref:glucose-1-phosphate cytidylyltransferase n=1 Tax=Metabacillus fastidiosus TaxID=1458 RepID=UPI003D2DF316
MKVVILAGGFGTRLSEETLSKPKPMVEIGNKPIIWHIMKQYSYYGFNDFIICLGYKGNIIKEYFSESLTYKSNRTSDYENEYIEELIYHDGLDTWRITLVDTGLNTMTGGRLKRIKPILNEKEFLVTYGDGVSNINIKDLVRYHQKHGKTVTISTTRPQNQFGILKIDNTNKVTEFREKPKSEDWINSGFFVMNSKVFDYIEGDETVFEEAPLSKLAFEGQLIAYKFQGFWHPMDTMNDKKILENLWKNNHAPWCIWNE